MMTDGVLDALPAEREEETMKEIIMDIQGKRTERDWAWNTGTGSGIQRLPGKR